MSRHGQSAAVDEVFITPRVVDAAAFEDFASRLRTLVSQTAAQREQLDGVAASARPLAATLQRAGTEVSSRVEAARGAAGALAERLHAVEAAVARMAELERRAGSLERAAAEAEARARAAVENAERRLADIERRAAAVAAEADAARERLQAAAREAAKPADEPPPRRTRAKRRKPGASESQPAEPPPESPPAPTAPQPAPLRRIDRVRSLHRGGGIELRF